ncbi:MAG: hypothetical protein NC211_07845 [Alistipes senegalensis]|nr:hypothetical protein [Oxalobacter formigenes]MCM1281717.1 hypothetical protein [Alistipes senegalensis]
MKACCEFAIAAFSCSLLIGIAYAQEIPEEKTAEPSRQITEGEIPGSRYGRRMRHHPLPDDYCGDSPCASYRRVSRMSHHDRQMLRQQVNEAGQTLYPPRHH